MQLPLRDFAEVIAALKGPGDNPFQISAPAENTVVKGAWLVDRQESDEPRALPTNGIAELDVLCGGHRIPVTRTAYCAASRTLMVEIRAERRGTSM